MVHDSYISRPQQTRQAVLMIHGICGTPRHFDFLISAFHTDWAIYNILLDGHGGTVRDFSRTSMKKWQAQTLAMLDSLSETYDRILVIGHSMGTLLLLQVIPHYPKVCGCILFNVPMYPRLHPKQIPRMLRLTFGKSRLDDPHEALFCQASSITMSKNLFLYLGWTPRYWELLQLCKHCRRNFLLSVPALVYLADQDELVSPRSKKYFLSAQNTRLRILRDASHFGFSPQTKQAVLSDIQSFICKL